MFSKSRKRLFFFLWLTTHREVIHRIVTTPVACSHLRAWLVHAGGTYASKLQFTATISSGETRPEGTGTCAAVVSGERIQEHHSPKRGWFPLGALMWSTLDGASLLPPATLAFIEHKRYPTRSPTVHPIRLPHKCSRHTHTSTRTFAFHFKQKVLINSQTH